MKKNGVNKDCISCSKSFYVALHRSDVAKYCSHACYSHTISQKIERVCIKCSSTFLTSPSKTIGKRGQFCSKKCSIGHMKLGSSHSEETKAKIRATSYVRFEKKENHPRWKGGITPINKAIRSSREYKTWRKHVFNRDNYTCQACGQKGGSLQADHVLPFAYYPDIRFEILNGQTLCVPCHRKTPTWGRTNIYENV